MSAVYNPLAMMLSLRNGISALSQKPSSGTSTRLKVDIGPVGVSRVLIWGLEEDSRDFETDRQDREGVLHNA